MLTNLFHLKSTANMFQLRLPFNNTPFNYMLKKLQLFLVVASLLIVTDSNAQPCTIAIQNNSITIAPATCSGTVATLKGTQPTGGNGTYTYRWEVTSGSCSQANFQTINGATGIDYAVPQNASTNVCFRRVVISGNCTSISNSVRVDNVDRTTPTAPSLAVIQPTCTVNTGSITVTSPAPATGITYSIDGVTYTNTTGIFTGLAAGTYNITARFPAGCYSLPSSVTLTGLVTPTGSISPATSAICQGNSQVLMVTGGISYQWSRNGSPIAGATSSMYTATESGTYTATISNGVCTGPASNSATVTVNPLPSGSISPSTATICAGDSVALTATGGSRYQWMLNGNEITGATGATHMAKLGGTYTVDIINAEGCKARSTNSSVVTTNSQPTGTISPSSATLCAGGSATLTVSGGSSYQWLLNGSPIQGANGSTYVTQQPGTYTVKIFSGTCSGNATNSVVVTANPPITFSVNSTAADCTTPTGSLTINNAAGGSGSGYAYSINNGTSFQPGNVFTGLAAGSYQVVVRDATGCRSNATTASIVPFTSTLQATVNTANIPCNQTVGSATVSVTGGTAPYVFSLNGNTPQASNTFNNLPAGAYNVLVKDAAGCNFAINFNITQTVSTLNASANVTDARCGQTTGAVSIQGTGGTAPYTYSLDNGTFQASNSYNNVPAGNHSAVVRDNTGCTVTINFEIRSIGTIPNLVITNPGQTCFGTTINLQAPAITAGSDASLVYTYWRDTNATLALANPAAVTAGTYYIKATNTTGCFSVKPVVVPAYSGTRGTITSSGPLLACSGFTITLTASSGQAYQWYRNDSVIAGATSATYSTDKEGIYSVTINDGTCNVPSANRIRIRDCSTLPIANVFVPTAFTPNKNGSNDVLRPILNGIRELRYFKVFNRWGQEVFKTNVTGTGWDGTIKGFNQPSETYSWVLECVDNSGNIIKRSGRSLLIR
jgi:trimeric autotransporter adhesin